MKNKLKPGKDYIGAGCGIMIINNKREILLKKRGKKSRNEIGWWEKTGGIIEYWEKAEKTVIRETKEELGIEVEIVGYFPHTDHIIKKDRQHWIGLNYLGKIKKGVPKNLEPEKCDEIRWFSLDNLPKKIVQPTKESIKNYLAGKYIKLK
ncbi:MAG: hypothetical protein A2343_02415 [Candidatus Moranbacteria bacterium RIFOXYB12_FULL_35_8]|nr:MAG: hypothetical protein A2343_02415 [Candidatus Moranbacteria bacterium RIFOXYB12_FULL_35_8]